MATVNFTIPDENLPAIAVAFERGVGIDRLKDETDEQLIVRHLLDYCHEREWVHRMDQKGRTETQRTDLITETP